LHDSFAGIIQDQVVTVCSQTVAQPGYHLLLCSSITRKKGGWYRELGIGHRFIRLVTLPGWSE